MQQFVYIVVLFSAIDDLYATPQFLWIPGAAGPKFNITTKSVSAAIIEYESTQPFTYHFEDMRDFFSLVKFDTSEK